MISEHPSPLKNPRNYAANALADARAMSAAEIAGRAASSVIGSVPVLGPLVNAAVENKRHREKAEAANALSAVTDGTSSAAIGYGKAHSGKAKEALVNGGVGALTSAAGALAGPMAPLVQAAASAGRSGVALAANLGASRRYGGDDALAEQSVAATNQPVLSPAELLGARSAEGELRDEKRRMDNNEVVPFRPLIEAGVADRLAHAMAGQIPAQAWGPETAGAHVGRNAEKKVGIRKALERKPGKSRSDAPLDEEEA